MNNASLVKKVAKVALNAVQSCEVAIATTAGLIDFPVPLNSTMRKTSAKTVRGYYLSGLRSYLPIAVTALREGVNLREGVQVLDFGCGVSRQLLHFARDYPQCRYSACDIDDTCIAFVKRAYPAVSAYTNTFTPPLAYGESSFDMVYSVSTFSHLNMSDQPEWLKELARITRHGGHCFLTTEGYSAIPALARELCVTASSLRHEVDQQGFFFAEYPDWREDAAKQHRIPVASTMVGVERSYGNAILSPALVRDTWNVGGLQVTGVIEGVIDNRQDLVVLEKTADR